MCPGSKIIVQMLLLWLLSSIIPCALHQVLHDLYMLGLIEQTKVFLGVNRIQLRFYVIIRHDSQQARITKVSPFMEFFLISASNVLLFDMFIHKRPVYIHFWQKIAEHCPLNIFLIFLIMLSQENSANASFLK